MKPQLAISALLVIAVGAGCASAQVRVSSPATPLPQDWTFPASFFWGAATSAHQVEGHNTKNDWWAWEQSQPPTFQSGQAADHWNRFEEDFQLAQSLGHTAHRFSLEWSRIEPEEGRFDRAAIEHYRAVIHSLRSKGMEPIVTLNHFTLPVWVARQGGWLSDRTPQRFAHYVAHATAELGGEVRYWITLNEPGSYVYQGYMLGRWPPNEQSLSKAASVLKRQLLGHVLAYEQIKQTYANRGWPEPQVGIAQQAVAFSPCSERSWRDRLSVRLRDQITNQLTLEALTTGRARYLWLFRVHLPRAGTLDFIGVNYFTRQFVHTYGLRLPDLTVQSCGGQRPSRLGETNSLSWEIYSEGLYRILKELAKYQRPLLVTENGVCTEHDEERAVFLVQHVRAVARAMHEGVPVIGYLYWSLLDNYEWGEGFGPRFGLIGVDFVTQRRTVRASARLLEQIIRSRTPDASISPLAPVKTTSR